MDPDNERRAERLALRRYLKRLREGTNRTGVRKKVPWRRQLKRSAARVGRNERCPCGSGKKFKKCCMVRKAPT